MKKIVLLALVSPILFSSVSIAAESNMSSEELKRVVCNHIQQNEEVKTAVSKAYSEVKTIINRNQRSILKELSSGNLDAINYCSNIQN